MVSSSRTRRGCMPVCIRTVLVSKETPWQHSRAILRRSTSSTSLISVTTEATGLTIQRSPATFASRNSTGLTYFPFTERMSTSSVTSAITSSEPKQRCLTTWRIFTRRILKETKHRQDQMLQSQTLAHSMQVAVLCLPQLPQEDFTPRWLPWIQFMRAKTLSRLMYNFLHKIFIKMVTVYLAKAIPCHLLQILSLSFSLETSMTMISLRETLISAKFALKLS